MKRILALFFIVATYSSFAQEMPIKVIASAGTTSTSSNISVSWTLGEMAVASLSTDSYLLTEGFHQGDLFLTSIDDDVNFTALDVDIYPNPVSSTFNILVTSNVEVEKQTSIQIVDVTGRVVYSKNVPIIQNEPYTVSVRHLNRGIYIVRVINSNRVKLIKLVKE